MIFKRFGWATGLGRHVHSRKFRDGSVGHPAESTATYNGHNERKIQIFWVGTISRDNAPFCQRS